MGPWNITFTNLAVAAAGLAVFVPYLVHLLTRRTPRRLVFPTVRFLRKAEASHSALFRLRDILLLLVRTAFVILLVLAFLKPVLRAQASRAEESGQHAAIIILDQSLSMGYTGTGFTPFARGQLAAGKIVEGLGATDVGNLILAGVNPRPSFTEPAANKYHLTRDLRDARSTLERADIDAAIAEALQQLSALPDLQATMYFVSDFQRTNWSAVNFSAIPEGVDTVFVPVPEEQPWNLAVMDVAVEPAAPVVGEDVSIICTVANFGGTAETIPVSLELRKPGAEDTAALEQEIAIPAGETATVNFRLRPRERGMFEGTVHIGADGLAADDTRYFTMSISDRIGVTLLTTASVDESGSGGSYLMHAIEPSRTGEGADETGAFEVTITTPDRFGEAPPADSQLVVLFEPGAIGETAASALARYIELGGSVIYFLSTPADGVNLAALETVTERNLQSPFSVNGAVDYTDNNEITHATFAEANFDEPMLRRFRESGDIGAAHFQKLLATQRVGGQGQILIRYSDGNIALARTNYGAGSLLLCNFDLSREGSDFARKTIFVPFIHEILKAMRPREVSGREHAVGYPAIVSASIPADAASVRYTNPAGEAVTASVERMADTTTIAFPDSAAPGFYRVHESDEQLAAAPVNVDARESDLSYLAEEQMTELMRASRRQFATVDGADPESVRRFLEGVPLWPYLLLAALAAIAIEQLLLIALRR
ncbi:MAG: BatA domain-containing protein [Candidatus Hydrogenedentes bacterium]|nr:BatA domain-containing protein [Candidatus Hydrogenedentota bacterium]